jgi:hypothetical protein
MAMRVDPVEVVGKPGGVSWKQRDFDRALDLWCHKAGKAGWEISIVSRLEEPGDAGLCGTVRVEGLDYRVYYGPRTRTTLIYDDKDGVERSIPALDYAVWAEPFPLDLDALLN